MKKSELFQKISGLLFFERWHPEVSLRYLPIVDEINKLGKSITILDVGSGGLGISPYLKREVTGLDVEFSPPFFRLLKRVKGSALSIPFNDDSFDVIVCADTLEHLSFTDRKKAIEEMLRVAKHKVYIGVPTGEKSQKQDERLDQEYFKLYNSRYHFLEEQIGFTLPKRVDLKESIESSAYKLKKNIKLEIRGNENLNLRYFLMKGWMSNNTFIDICFRKVMLLFIPVFKLLNSEPTYRTLFFVTITS